MSEPHSPVTAPVAAWENAGRGRLAAARITTKPAMCSIINRLAKWDVRNARFAMLSCLRFGGALWTGEGGTGLDPKSFFCTVLGGGRSRRQRGQAKPNKPMGLNTLIINKISQKPEKQTHGDYHPWYQSLTGILGPILKKYEWNYERSCDVL
jgi:hypothetical protein